MHQRKLAPFILSIALAASPCLGTGLFGNKIAAMVTFGDSYSVQNVGDGRVQWPDYVAGYLKIALYDYARSGATCSDLLTPREYPGVTEDELPLFLQQKKNGTVVLDRDPLKTIYTLWVGTNDVGAGCLLTGDQKPGATIVDTTKCTIEWAKTLYKNGARNFLFQNMVPLQRIPMYARDAYPTRYWKAAKNATEWNTFILELVNSGNALSRYMLTDLAPQLPGAHVGLFDSYGLFTDILDHPKLYLNGTAPYNTTGSVNPCVYAVDGHDPLYCTLVNGTDADSYVWHNELHASHQTNRVVAKEIASVIRGEKNKWVTWLS
ncbi:carbohydrate esterase family 16 protein [Botryobasidium botryosum FD-172 SS1]|uniref:Carbohydrate esterase family 16 protein n=1 Tax=Botryobasidium botryosum (strain FD-172 SS1) TaxID=930990 RepID=A0A067N3S0_BOTB1|nr:carbohydrate esterase family 16 protein [Botryobasidium botryosum FD-172 SS1]